MTDSSHDKGGNQKTPYEAALFRKLICSPANPRAQGVMNRPGEMNQSHEELQQCRAEEQEEKCSYRITR